MAKKSAPPKATKPAKTKPPKVNRSLDELHGALVTKGVETHVAVLIREVYDDAEPSAERVLAAVGLLGDDERFVVVKDGIKSRVRIAGPEEVRLPQAETTTTAAPVAETPTLGELAEKAREEEAAKKAAKPAPAATQDDGQIAAIKQACELRDGRRVALVKLEKRLKEAKALQKAEDKHGVEALKKSVAQAKDEEEQADIHLEEVIGGQASILKVKVKSTEERADAPPSKMKTGRKPQDAKAPATAKAKAAAEDAPADPRGRGAKDAIAGKLETACPFEMTSVHAAQWLDGWRTQMRADGSERRGIVQALTEKKLGDALAKNLLGLLKPGEASPKVATVMCDARPHMVVGALSGAESGTPGISRWHLQPLFEIADWKAMHSETYGPPIPGVDASDEAKANRQKGGVDCGRIVKVGNAKYVVGPRQLLTVFTTGESDAKTAKAS